MPIDKATDKPDLFLCLALFRGSHYPRHGISGEYLGLTIDRVTMPIARTPIDNRQKRQKTFVDLSIVDWGMALRDPMN